MPADRGYYGPKKGNSDRDGHEGWAPRMPPVSRQRGVPEHDLKGRVDHGKHRMVPRGGRLRSRSWSRSRPQLRQQSRSGSPPHAHASDKRCRSTSSGKDQSSSRIRCEATPWIVLHICAHISCIVCCHEGLRVEDYCAHAVFATCFEHTMLDD